MEVKSAKIINIMNQLFSYSNHYIEIRNDINLNIPAFSVIEKNIYGRYVPYILINLNLIPDDINIIAHILSHEWGHHLLNHLIPIDMINNKNISNKDDRQKKENEADAYASKFICKKGFNKDIILNFFKQYSLFDYENRKKILCNPS